MDLMLHTLSDLLHGMAEPEDLAMFNRVVCRITGDGCWIVENYSLKANGYPRFRHPDTGNMAVIQRCVWETIHGCIPANKVVVRVCGNTNCTNPDHLKLRDKAETQDVMKARRVAENRQQLAGIGQLVVPPDLSGDVVSTVGR